MTPRDTTRLLGAAAAHGEVFANERIVRPIVSIYLKILYMATMLLLYLLWRTFEPIMTILVETGVVLVRICDLIYLAFANGSSVWFC